jgi:hypothetical protein
MRNNQLDVQHNPAFNGEFFIGEKKEFEKRTKDQSAIIDKESRNTTIGEASVDKPNLQKRVNDFTQKILTVEAYIKERKLQKDFSISICARDLGISINEVRSILSYLLENKFKCTSCMQRYKTLLELNTHTETQHKL